MQFFSITLQHYNWKAKFGSLTVSDTQRLTALKAEHTKLKRFLADSPLYNGLRTALWRNLVGMSARTPTIW